MSLSLFDLTGKRALITGSSQGIGFALAKGLQAAGAEIVLNGRNAEKLAEAAKNLGGSVHQLSFDVTDHEGVRSAVDGFEADTGAIDILVNNAGMQHRTELQDFPADAFERLLQTNIASVFHVGQAAARHMIGRGAGKIINICSVQTALARPGIAPYTATKGAVANLTKGMATDWAKYGLQCNGLAPGYFDTPLNAALVADPEFSAWLEKRTPAGRWGNVDELVGTCIFLASAASSFVNGTTVFVDGGITASPMSRYVIMGVSGCGKSHIGALFAEAQGARFIDGDDLHPRANIDKMARGEPLDDADRAPWLDIIGERLRTAETAIACSALKRTYRDRITQAAGNPVTFLFLRGREETLRARMTEREGHFMPPALLQSQLATLEPPTAEERSITADIEAEPVEIVARFRTGLKELSI